MEASMSTRQRSRPAVPPTVHAGWPHRVSAFLLLAVTVPLTGVLLLARTPLLVPSISLIALVISAIVALAAWCLASDRRGAGITLWDVSGAYAFVGLAAGMLSDPQQVLEF
jgi:hypothetical protein